MIGVDGGRVGRDVAVGWLTWVAATVAGGCEVGVVVWLGVQPENMLIKMATMNRVTVKRYFIFALLDAR